MRTFAFFLVALLAVCAYLCLSGGRTGRWTALIALVTAVAAQIVAVTAHSVPELQFRMFLCDLVTLAAFGTIAMMSNRWWPLWITAMQFNTVLAETAILLSPVFRYTFFYAMSTIWAVPTMTAMVVGTFLDSRHDTRAARPNPSRNNHG